MYLKSNLKHLKLHEKDNNIAFCLITFVILFILLLSVCGFVKYYNTILFHVSLFFTGWFAWTFLEYMTHRYLMHQKHTEKQLIDFNHIHHHTHPTDIRISAFQRSLLLLFAIILILLSTRLHNYFTLAAGFLSGFPVYTVIHFLLHQKIMQGILKKMVSYHIYHHCKRTDKCFGISVTWWDDILKTNPPEKVAIPGKVINFYFKK